MGVFDMDFLHQQSNKRSSIKTVLGKKFEIYVKSFH